MFVDDECESDDMQDIKLQIVEIINRLKSKFTISQKEVLDDIETPVIQKFATFGDSEKNQPGDLIKEQ